MKNVRVLVLEDDLETLENIFRMFKEIEIMTPSAFGVTVLPDHGKVEEFINKNPNIKFDILLLDRDCFLGGSFYNLDLGLFNLDNVISISTVPNYNQEAVNMGVKRVVQKDYKNLKGFADKLKDQILDIVK